MSEHHNRFVYDAASLRWQYESEWQPNLPSEHQDRLKTMFEVAAKGVEKTFDLFFENEQPRAYRWRASLPDSPVGVTLTGSIVISDPSDTEDTIRMRLAHKIMRQTTFILDGPGRTRCYYEDSERMGEKTFLGSIPCSDTSPRGELSRYLELSIEPDRERQYTLDAVRHPKTGKKRPVERDVNEDVEPQSFSYGTDVNTDGKEVTW